MGPLLRLAFHVLNSPRLLRAAEVASWGPVLARDVGADAEAVAEAAGSRIGKALRLSDAGGSSRGQREGRSAGGVFVANNVQ